METCSRCAKQSERATADKPGYGMLWDDYTQTWKCQICIKITGKIHIGVAG